MNRYGLTLIALIFSLLLNACSEDPPLICCRPPELIERKLTFAEQYPDAFWAKIEPTSSFVPLNDGGVYVYQDGIESQIIESQIYDPSRPFYYRLFPDKKIDTTFRYSSKPQIQSLFLTIPGTLKVNDWPKRPGGVYVDWAIAPGDRFLKFSMMDGFVWAHLLTIYGSDGTVDPSFGNNGSVIIKDNIPRTAKVVADRIIFQQFTGGLISLGTQGEDFQQIDDFLDVIVDYEFVPFANGQQILIFSREEDSVSKKLKTKLLVLDSMGKRVTSFNNGEHVEVDDFGVDSLFVESDNSILMAGKDPQGNVLLVRLSSTGSPKGIKSLNFENIDHILGVARLADGKVALGLWRDGSHIRPEGVELEEESFLVRVP